MDEDYCNSVYDDIRQYENFEMGQNRCYGKVDSRKSGKDTDDPSKNSCKKMVLIVLFLFLTALLFAAVGACMAFIYEIVNLKSQTASLLQSSQDYNTLRIDLDTLRQQSESQWSQYYSALENRTEQLEMPTQRSFDGLEFQPAASCAALPPSSPSGYYWVRASNGSAVRVYCDVTRSCGGVTGGWRRVAELDMTDSSSRCPSSLVQRNDANRRTCAPTFDNCSSLILPTSLEYSSVCGRITGYQIATLDTFGSASGPTRTLEDNYVDGVSLTHGNPRQHIWTFAAGQDEAGTQPQFNCACNSGTSTPPPSVGNDYFCDTGSEGRVGFRFYSEDPLWDGAGCSPQNTCCSFNNPPWFHKQLPQPTDDSIEMRVCRDQHTPDEDLVIEAFEIYVQ